MSSESAAFQAAQQRHHHYMVFGKKQRYIEVFQCSGEDMNHVLTGSTAATPAGAPSAPVNPVSASSPVKPGGDSVSASSGPAGHSAAVAAAAAAATANGLLPPGMFTVPSATTQHTTLGLDPNSAILAAAQMQNPLLFSMPPNTYPPTARPPTAPSSGPTSADMFGMQQQGLLLAPNAMMAMRPQPQLGLMAAAYNPANPALLQAQQIQLQQQLLQSQLAAQRLLLAPAQAGGAAAAGQMGQPGLIGPQIPTTKRSFDQAFTNATTDSGAKRTNFGNPTISAGPTTYSR